ncbi:MAG: response regulator [Treponema sp.]|jgi:DNA-binding response OmpR family regulator|nr:response regulator [Treponema sp.]
MKNILVIDESPLFREYLWTKFTENAIDITMAGSGRDGLAKMRTLKPDLVLLDYHIRGVNYLEVLQQKKDNSGIADIPVIITAKRLDQDKIIELVPYNVRKVFTKPIKIDALFGAIAQLLNVRFDLDASPGQVDVHINDNIIFIEISQGLNQDKLELLQFKMLELIELYGVRSPRLLVMISNTRLGPADTPKLYSLFEIVTKIAAGGQQNIRALTRDEYAAAYLASRKEFKAIQIAENLTAAIEQLLGERISDEETAAIDGRLLSRQEQTGVGETVQLTFAAEDGPPVTLENIQDMLKDLKIAAVDDDFVIQELIKNTFQRAGAMVSTFPDGGAYLAALESVSFDLTFLDMMMPSMDGFAVLRAMNEKDIRQPVIVLSAISQRESVIRAFKLGIKSYLVKPLRPGAIFKKTLEVLRATF